MWFFSPQIVKIIANITLIGLGFLSVPGSTFAFNLNARGFFTKKVDASDQFIRNLNLQADCIVDTTAGAVTFYTEHAFSAIEKLTGLSTQNQLYRYGKNNSLATVGFGLGLLKGTKDFATGTVSLLAYLDSMPARTVTLAYNVQERPLEYKAKVINGGKNVAAVLQNPLPLLGGIYQWGYHTYTEAQKDPLKKGQLYGEGTVFVGTFLLGGGQLKGAVSAQQAVKASQTGTLATGKLATGTLGKAGAVTKVSSSAGKAVFTQGGMQATTGVAAKTGTVAGSASTGILAQVAASLKRMDWGALIPDFSALHLGFGAATPTLAGPGKVFNVKAHSVVPPLKTADTAPNKLPKYPINPNANLDNYPWIFDKIVPEKLEYQMSRWGDKAFADWRHALTRDEKLAISAYTKNGYKKINAVLRGTATPKDYIAQTHKQIDLLSSALRKAIMPETILTFRTTSFTPLGKLADLKPYELIGKTIQEKGFFSTSLLPNYYQPGRLYLVVKVPQGVNAANVAKLSPFAYRGRNNPLARK